MNKDERDQLFKFMFQATRPQCRTCCYWLNGMSLILDYALRGFEFEKNLTKKLTDEE